MTSKPTFQINNTTYKLSIQLNLNGFSFCIANSERQIIVEENCFELQQLSSEQVLFEKLKQAFDTKPELQAKFEIIEVIYAHELYCFVPKEIYDSTNKAAYFKYTLKTLATDYISEDTVAAVPIINLFIPYVNINNYLVERFNEFSYRHSSSLLLDYVLKKEALETQKKVYLYFQINHFDIIVLKGSKLELFNTFSHQASTDVLYYTLFVLEQLGLSPESTTVKILNDCKSEVFELLFTYIRNLEKSNTSQSAVLLHHLALNL